MEKEPVHIKAKPGELAEKVVIAGDPGRVDQLSQMLEDARLVSSNRGFNVYTGRYRDQVYSVACHGIGGPSSAIVFEELRMLGAKVVIRLGTAGSLSRDIEEGDLVIPNTACYYIGSGTISAYAPGIVPPTTPSFNVLETLVNEARRSLNRFWIGPIVSSDAFYAEDEDFVSQWTRVGVIAVEMECATLFTLSHIYRMNTGAVLIITDNLVKKSRVSRSEKVREWVAEAAKIVFEALRKIEVKNPNDRC
ncbi:MAG: purine-nucleoside phosphorylase [Aigarchaeota archaeon]|nr:purine-nucleoside phosphorylase [Aigarchaeota archaeon]MCX8192962.1 purine-nucleoside phosphorylase [Nitrososphaeria archaeon]MDW7986393.1 purine-nucleoside phosphorylase [Nitrososphaerota archaeon]